MNSVKTTTNLSRFNGLVKQDAALEKAAKLEMDELFGSAAPSRYEASHLTRCIDGSGSMWDLVAEVKSALKDLNEEFPEISKIDLIFADRISRLATTEAYQANGNTALRDSILAAIAVTEAEIGHNNVMVVILSDGMDNASQASVAEVRAAVEEKKALGWQFFAIFMEKKQQLGWKSSAGCSAFEALGLESVAEGSIAEAIKKLADGIYGYLETGKLYLPETT